MILSVAHYIQHEVNGGRCSEFREQQLFGTVAQAFLLRDKKARHNVLFSGFRISTSAAFEVGIDVRRVIHVGSWRSARPYPYAKHGVVSY